MFLDSGVKVTAEYDYDGDEVTGFRLKNGDALFLMPLICSYKATTVAFAKTHYLNYGLRLGLRGYYKDDFEPAVDPGEDTGTTEYTDLYDAVAYHVALADARAMSVYYDFDIMDYVRESVPPENALSDPPFSPTGPPPLGSWALTRQILYTGYGLNLLAAIVKRGSQTFYIWLD